LDITFEEYIERLSDPIFLLKGCNKFHEGEGLYYLDELAESVWQQFLKGGEKPSKYLILGAAEAILIQWNAPYLFKDKPEELIEALKNDEFSKDLESAYESAEPLLGILYILELGSPHFTDYLSIIEQVYDVFRKQKTIGMTGAAKALHFIHPRLFVPWDTSIRTEYHNKDPSHRKDHGIGDPECYSDFMKRCNDIAIKLLRKISWEELAKGHPDYRDGESRAIRTIPKMLDECNWCWITSKERWDP